MKPMLALLGAPVAWVIQVTLSAILASRACYPGAAPLAQPAWPWLEPALFAIGLACLAVGIYAACTALALNRQLGGHASDRRHFAGKLMLFINAIFVVAIGFTLCAMLILSPCHRWS